jgi:tetratricopeptide (TPR) repeat protein
MHLSQNWCRNPLPHLVSATTMALSLVWMPVSAQSSGVSLELISPQQIQQEEFEPAVGEQVRAAYNEAVRNPTDPEAVGRLGMIFQCYGKYELADICYRRAWALEPGSSGWVYYLGNLEAWLGKEQQAIAHVREALKLDADYAPARVRLGQLLFESGDTVQSRRAFEESIRQRPRLATAHLGLGRVLAAQGDWPAAIGSYSRACEIFPNYAAAHYALAMAYRKIGDESKAREQLELYGRFREASQPSEDPLMDAVKSLYRGGLAHFAKGSSLAQQGHTKEATKEFEAALQVNPRLIMAHVNLIAMYGDLGLLDKAEEHFREAVRLDPGWAEVYYNWGLLLYRKRRMPEAAAEFRKAIEANPNYVDAHIELGQLLDDTDRIYEAQKHFRRALENAPANRQAHYVLGRSLIRTGQLNEAIIELLETIRVEDDKTPVCMQALAAAYQRAGDLNHALHYTSEARQRAVARKMDALAAQLQGDLDRLTAETKAR